MAGFDAGAPRRPLCLAEVEPGSDNERLGVARDSMLCNPLILKAEVGKPRRNCYTLPGFDFAYGLYIGRTDGGVPEAIGHWNTAKPRVNIGQDMPRDFITMNIAALKDGCRTAHDFNLYYKAKDIRCKRDDSRRCPPKVPPDMTYGIPTRTCTPLIDLLQHKYKELWMEQQRALTVHQETEKKKIHKLRENRTTFLRKHPAPAQEESFWHLPRLEKFKAAKQPRDFPKLIYLYKSESFNQEMVFHTTLMYSSYVLSKSVQLAYVSNHLSPLPVSMELLLPTVSRQEHDRSLLNSLWESHEILGQASSLQLLSPQTFPSLFIFQPMFFFMLSPFVSSMTVVGFLPQLQLSNLRVFFFSLSFPSSSLPSQEKQPKEEGQFSTASADFVLLLS